jgi:hypothetical protein
MVRASLLAALTALLLLSTGAAQAQQAQSQRESDERALSNYFNDRDEYRTKLLLELQRRETLLTKQQRTLATQDARLQELYGKLGTPVSDEEEDAAPQPVAAQPQRGPGGRKLPPETPQGRRAKDLETQIYKTNLARYNVVHTTKDIAELKTLLARNPQRP